MNKQELGRKTKNELVRMCIGQEQQMMQMVDQLNDLKKAFEVKQTVPDFEVGDKVSVPGILTGKVIDVIYTPEIPGQPEAVAGWRFQVLVDQDDSNKKFEILIIHSKALTQIEPAALKVAED